MEKQEESKKPEGQMLLHLPGVEGTSTEKDYLGWIPVIAYQVGVGWDVSRGGRFRRRAPPSGDNAEEKPEPKLRISNASMSALSIRVNEDLSSPIILHACVNKSIFPEASVIRLSPDGVVVSSLLLKEVVVSSFSLSAAREEGKGGAWVGLNFEEIEYNTKSETAVTANKVSYHISKHIALLNGESVPSSYVPPEGDDNDN